MKPAWALLLGCLLAATLAAKPGQAQQGQPKLGRSVHGVVLNARYQPLSTAIVYLKNRSTKMIHTAITDNQGAYSFHQLAPNTDYEIYAEWKGKRSSVRIDSAYNSQPDVRLDLTIPVA